MTLLEDHIKSVFGSVFGAAYGDGTLRKVALVPNGKGGWTESVAEYPIKCQRDRASEGMRESAQRGSNTSRAGHTGRDCKLFVLQQGVPVEPDTDDIILYQGRTWAVSQVSEDPAASHWTMYGVEMRAQMPVDNTDTGSGT